MRQMMRCVTRTALVGVVLAVGSAPMCWAEAVVGKRAPAFTLTDQDGQKRSLTEFQGKFIVLEWFNYDCPFTRKHYTSGNMQRLQQTYTDKGVVWLSVNSSAPGKQGNLTAQQAQTLTKEKGASPTTVFLDSHGDIGRLYGAKTTPHLFVINPEGVLIYNGAIDDKPSTDPADVAGARNYVAQALDEAMAGQPVSVPTTQPYGCSVKY